MTTATAQAPASAPRTPDDALTVAYYTPGWPPGRVANGIVSYIGNVLEGLRSQPGVRGLVLTPKLAVGEKQDDNVVMLPPAKRSMLGKLCGVFSPPLQPGDPEAVRMRAKQIVKTVEQLVRERGLDVLEIEEAFGMAGHIAPAVSIPVIVRLHGPWFLNGAALGMPQDEKFRERDQLELPGLTAAAVVTGVSKQCSKQRASTTAYRFPTLRSFTTQSALPIDQRWSPEKCGSDHILSRRPVRPAQGRRHGHRGIRPDSR
jgi:hypothetical protein